MSNTDDELRTARKEIQRLARALERAQSLNTGLQQDKDWAYRILTMLVKKQGTVILYRSELERHNPATCELKIERDMPGNTRLSVTAHTRSTR